MKRICCITLALCLILCAAIAFAAEWVCESCGSRETGNFCTNCGSRRPSWVCSGCGAQNEGKFCTNCGAARGASSDAGRTLVAGALSSVDPDVPNLTLCCPGLSITARDTVDNVAYRQYDCEQSAYDSIKAYVDLLCSEYGFTLAGSPFYESFTDSTFFDFGLNRTGDAALPAAEIKAPFSAIPCDLAIYGAIEDGETEGQLIFNAALKEGGSGEAHIGDSFASAMYRTADGSFETADGAMRAAPGEAMLIEDGETVVRTSYLTSINDALYFSVIDDENGIDVYFYFENDASIKTGAVFDRQNFVISDEDAIAARGCYDSLPVENWSAMFAAWHQGEYILPVQDEDAMMTGLSLRVMYADEEIAVIYACAQYDAAPNELQMLAAFPLTDSRTGAPIELPGAAAAADTTAVSGVEQMCVFCSGSGQCASCGGTGTVTRLYEGSSEWDSQQCTACDPAGSGDCALCGGDGKR